MGDQHCRYCQKKLTASDHFKDELKTCRACWEQLLQGKLKQASDAVVKTDAASMPSLDSSASVGTHQTETRP